jgi:hypothetical protein
VNPQKSELLNRLRTAKTHQEQVALLAQIDEFDARTAAAIREDRSIDWTRTIVEETLRPVRVHEMHTAATEWLEGVPSSGDYHREILAKVASWYGRTSDEVKADAEEFAEQARGIARREASQYGENAQAAETAALEYLSFLRQREGASGLDQVEQTVAPDGVTVRPTELPAEPFDNFAPPVDPINEGVVGTESSERNPQWAEFEGGSPAPYSNLSSTSVAINHQMNLDEFRARQAAVKDVTTGDAAYPSDAQLQSLDELGYTAPLNSPSTGAEVVSQPGYGAEQIVQRNKAAALKRRKEAAARQAASQMTYHESYGDVSKAQLAAYRKHNISPSDHDDLVRHFGEDPEAITKWVKEQGAKGPVSTYNLGRDRWASKTAADGDSQTSNDQRYPAGSYLGDQGSSSAEAALASQYGLSTDEVRQAFPNPQAALDALERQSRAASLKIAGRVCRNCTNGNHSGTNGTPGCSGGSCACTAANCGKASGGGTGSGNPEKTAASTLDQIQQTVAPDGVTVKPTPLPEEVMFPIVQDWPETNTEGLVDPDTRAAVEKVSSTFTPADAQDSADFRKGYAFASKWKAGKPLALTGSVEFEAGLYAGITDNPAAQSAWVKEHAKQAAKHPVFAQRMATHDAFTSKVAAKAKGLTVEGAYLKTALTETDLNTAGPGSSPNADGSTPINGQGSPGPLDGQSDAAAAGGPAPYNGAEPLGAPVVPGAVLPPSVDPASTVTHNGPPNPFANAQTVAFRQRVQANLVNPDTNL